MSDSTRPDYAKTGFAALACIAAIIGVLVYYGGFASGRNVFFAETWYDAPVSGLSVGSEVNLRGVKVGEVKSISFIGSDYEEAAEEDLQKIRIVFALDSRLVRRKPGAMPEETIEYLVWKGVRATVSSSGITGLSKVELNYPKDAGKPPKLSWHPQYVCIPPYPSILESFTDSITKVMNHLNKMDLAAAGSNIVSIVSSAAKAVEGAGDFIETQMPALKEAVSNIESASGSLGAFAREVKDNPSLLIRSRDEKPLPETDR